MNAVEIEEAISDLALQPFDAAEFPYAFLAAFGNKDTTLKRLRTGNNNTSDLPGGVLQRSNIHIAVCEAGAVGETLKTLRASPATTKAKAKFILATDGQTLEAEELAGGETIACAYPDFPNHFGFFLPLAGISTIKEIKDNPVDVRATGRLNKLYVELLRENPDWAKDERRADMNHFMARLVFCFFAEDTDIFNGTGLFTQTVEQMSERDGSNTHEVLSEIFRAMNIKVADRNHAQPRLPNWAKGFPYVNGGLFSGSTDVPRLTRMARTYLLHTGGLNWKQLNPDIFGSMIQAVADDEERGALGMHYTSVPNILKVLNPLFLDDLRTQLAESGDNERKLLNLRKRMARIRVFDPACGSGNFLVIAYKQMREIEAEINRRRGESHRGSDIPLTNFRGIELRNFPAEIARLALIIAEFQCDVLYRGQKDALAEFLPLDAQNWIVCGNALRLDWLSTCPPTGMGVKLLADDLFGTPLDQAEIDFENEGGETYICGNPPYIWANNQSAEQKKEILSLQEPFGTKFKGLDYVAGWIYKYALYSRTSGCDAAFVTTNSIVQGEQVDVLWGALINDGCSIKFAHRSFKWQNLASRNAGVSVVVVGITRTKNKLRFLFDGDERISTQNISPYLLPMDNIWVKQAVSPMNNLIPMYKGSQPTDGGGLILSAQNAAEMIKAEPMAGRFIYGYIGSDEISTGKIRKCLWISDDDAEIAANIPAIAERLEVVKNSRIKSPKKQTNDFAEYPHRFTERRRIAGEFIAVPCVSSEGREYLTPVLLEDNQIVSNRCFGAYQSPRWYLAIISSRLHYCWCETTSGKLETRLNYSNTLTWNTFPIPLLTEQNKTDLTACAENILLAREAHFPATIADLYDPAAMPDNLRQAHARNDEVLERIYIGRRFKNDTERLEKLFELYTKMTTKTVPAATTQAKSTPKSSRGKKV